MSKPEKQLREDVLSDLSWEIQKIVCQCNNLGEALKLLTSTLAAFVDFHVSDKIERGLIMDGCIKQLRQFKKQMQKGGAE